MRKKRRKSSCGGGCFYGRNDLCGEMGLPSLARAICDVLTPL